MYMTLEATFTVLVTIHPQLIGSMCSIARSMFYVITAQACNNVEGLLCHAEK